jgi:hypothetical protein
MFSRTPVFLDYGVNPSFPLVDVIFIHQRPRIFSTSLQELQGLKPFSLISLYGLFKTLLELISGGFKSEEFGGHYVDFTNSAITSFDTFKKRVV